MKIDIFTLCDTAQEYNGKLMIIGTFNYIYAEKFPTIHSELALVARITFNEKEKGIHKIEICIKKNDNDTFLMPLRNMTIDTTTMKEKEAGLNIIIKGNNIAIPEAGIYTATIKVDGNIFESTLNIVQQKP